MSWKEEMLGILEETGRSDGRPAWAVEAQKRYCGSDSPYDYYRVLHQVARKYRPALTLEIGTDRGISAAAIATGNPAGQVITLDVNPQSVKDVQAMPLPNVQAFTCDSLAFDYKAMKGETPIDLLYIDGDHTFWRAYTEYYTNRKFMRTGGIVIVDDLLYPELKRMWDAIPDEKVELHRAHNTGFGAARVNLSVKAPRLGFIDE
jgi:predicted O-methyltransferase YrrM